MAVPYGDGVVRLRADFHGDEGTLEAEHVFFGKHAGVRIRGVRRDEAAFRDLATPADFSAGSDPADLFSPYLLHSAGPRPSSTRSSRASRRRRASSTG